MSSSYSSSTVVAFLSFYGFPILNKNVDGIETATFQQTFMLNVSKGVAVNYKIYSLVDNLFHHTTLANSIEVPFEKSIKVLFLTRCVLLDSFCYQTQPNLFNGTCRQVFSISQEMATYLSSVC